VDLDEYQRLFDWYVEHCDLPLGSAPAFPLFEALGSEVLLTAPHAVRTLSPSGSSKLADAATGPLARALSAASGASCLVAHSPWPGNANADPLERCAFKQRMVELLSKRPSTVLDLHGMLDSHGCDVCIGTHKDGPSALADQATELLAAQGFVVRRNDPFGARSPSTVTATALGAGAAAIQLEIAARWRNPVQRPDEAGAMYRALLELVSDLATAASLT